MTVASLRDGTDNLDAIRELAWSLRKTGTVQMQQSKIDDAVQTFTEEVCVRRQVVERAPGNTLFLTDLGFALMKLGDAEKRTLPPDLDGAGSAYREALHWRLRLTVDDPSRRSFVTDLVVTMQALAELYARAGNQNAASVFKKAGNSIEERIDQVIPSNVLALHAEVPTPDKTRVAVPHEELLASVGTNDRAFIELLDQDFETTLLLRIEAEARSCWDHIVRSIGPAASSGTGKP
jgi:hypothetical protein